MFTAEKFNKGGALQFTNRLPENAPYMKLKQLEAGRVYKINGLYISTKGNYGETPIACLDDMGVYLPKHLLDTVNEMRKDEECVAAINAGRVGIKPYIYKSKKGEDCFSVNWVDIKDDTPDDDDDFID